MHNIKMFLPLLPAGQECATNRRAHTIQQLQPRVNLYTAPPPNSTAPPPNSANSRNSLPFNTTPLACGSTISAGLTLLAFSPPSLLLQSLSPFLLLLHPPSCTLLLHKQQADQHTNALQSMYRPQQQNWASLLDSKHDRRETKQYRSERTFTKNLVQGPKLSIQIVYISSKQRTSPQSKALNKTHQIKKKHSSRQINQRVAHQKCYHTKNTTIHQSHRWCSCTGVDPYCTNTSLEENKIVPHESRHV